MRELQADWEGSGLGVTRRGGVRPPSRSLATVYQRFDLLSVLRSDKARNLSAWSSKARNFLAESNALLGHLFRAETPLSRDRRDGGATGGPWTTALLSHTSVPVLTETNKTVQEGMRPVTA
ncbi:hypothetical protein SADUNF_Sadunf16G0159100 [Salix dunnii]|uniref:Uncharacterized protein n=1 Tax=Salix dunnii TaxID=1413687 RepID=A0A835JBF0_9ROSI|nr:hypothetical protein SADUNF_Sadunf16G0159100 [Salix dunnii]